MRAFTKLFACLVATTTIFGATVTKGLSAAEPSRSSWGPYRGFNVTPQSSDAELALAKRYGANMVRISFGIDPLMSKTAPHYYNVSAFQRLDHIIDKCQELGLQVVIDPHTTPGTADRYTTSPSDPFWHDAQLHDYLNILWYSIANRYKNKTNIAGYDLLNEPSFATGYPAPPATPPVAADWNKLVGRLVSTIRSTGDRHWIVVETQVGNVGRTYVNRLEGINYLRLPADNKIVVSPHMYAPQQFTLQGTGGNPVGPDYPGVIRGQNWNSAALDQAMQPILQFQRSHPAVPIWIGEFSATLYGSKGSDVWVSDVIKVMESHGWSWAYHDFRQTPWFDAERPVSDPNHRSQLPSGQSGNQPRMLTLKYYFNRNN